MGAVGGFVRAWGLVRPCHSRWECDGIECFPTRSCLPQWIIPGPEPCLRRRGDRRARGRRIAAFRGEIADGAPDGSIRSTTISRMIFSLRALEHIPTRLNRLMGHPGPWGRSGAPRDVGHRASAATHPRAPGGPPQAGFFRAVTAIRSPTDAPHRHRERMAVTTQNHPGQTFQSGRKVL